MSAKHPPLPDEQTASAIVPERCGYCDRIGESYRRIVHAEYCERPRAITANRAHALIASFHVSSLLH